MNGGAGGRSPSSEAKPLQSPAGRAGHLKTASGSDVSPLFFWTRPGCFNP